MIVKVHRPTRILADAGLHAVSDAEALRLIRIGVAEKYIEPEPDPVPAPEETAPDPVQEKPKKKRATKKKTAKAE